jgi:nucleoside-diphosphate-sugar epimerase
LIAGVHGVSGRAAAKLWTSLPGAQVYGLSRRAAPLPPGVEAISADLLDRDNLQRKLGQISGITHIVFAAYIEKPTAIERSEDRYCLAITQKLGVQQATFEAGSLRLQRGQNLVISSFR